MVPILYEDKDIIVVHKPAGLESQSSRSFAPDMVSEIRRYLHNSQNIHKLTTVESKGQPPYVGVIHRLDKPVSGIMVYAKNQKSAAALSAALQAGKVDKNYMAVVCGKLVDKQGAYVDYLRQDKKNNTSTIVDKSVRDARKSVLRYREMEVIHSPADEEKNVSLVDIELLTGRHHQIRVQMAGHGTPLYGDGRYGRNISTMVDIKKEPDTGSGKTEGYSGRGALECGNRGASGYSERHPAGSRPSLALCAYRLAFAHPDTGERLQFEIRPSGGAFDWFCALRGPERV